VPQLVFSLHLYRSRFSFNRWLILFMGESAPSRLILLPLHLIRCFIIYVSILPYFWFDLWIYCFSIVRTHRLQKLFPSISLNTKLLLSSTYFTSSIGVKVALLKLLDKFFNIGYNFVDKGLISSKIWIECRLGFDTDCAIKIIITIFHGLNQSYDSFIRWIELSAHLLYGHILF
jgi:hypothetical protein